MNISKRTAIQIGNALEMSVAFHVLKGSPTAAIECERVLERLRHALHLPKDYLFTSENAAMGARERAGWLRAKEKR